MNIEDVSPELREELLEKLSECENPADVMKLAAENGVELTEEQLDAVSGGSAWDVYMRTNLDYSYGEGKADELLPDWVNY